MPIRFVLQRPPYSYIWITDNWRKKWSTERKFFLWSVKSLLVRNKVTLPRQMARIPTSGLSEYAVPPFLAGRRTEFLWLYKIHRNQAALQQSGEVIWLQIEVEHWEAEVQPCSSCTSRAPISGSTPRSPSRPSPNSSTYTLSWHQLTSPDLQWSRLTLTYPRSRREMTKIGSLIWAGLKLCHGFFHHRIINGRQSKTRNLYLRI